jgi:hypothetical protein
MHLLLLLLTLQINAWANVTYDVRISDLDHGQETLVFLSNGIVAKLQNRPQLLLELEKLKNSQQLARVKLDNKRRLLKLTFLSASPLQVDSHFKNWHAFRPSVIPSLDVAKTIFKTARYVSKESQCYNRAHIWAFEWFLKHGLSSEKTFLFFTRKYIRKYNFEWWFHVAPSVQVIDGPNVEDRIMDVKYALNGPMRLKSWTDVFMRNDAACPIITKYSEYANYPESDWCYVMKVPMYYYQPIDLENLEDSGAEKEIWMEAEVSAAYLEAFNQIWPVSGGINHGWH